MSDKPFHSPDRVEDGRTEGPLEVNERVRLYEKIGEQRERAERAEADLEIAERLGRGYEADWREAEQRHRSELLRLAGELEGMAPTEENQTLADYRAGLLRAASLLHEQAGLSEGVIPEGGGPRADGTVEEHRSESVGQERQQRPATRTESSRESGPLAESDSFQMTDRERAINRLNYAMRKGSTDDPYIKDKLDQVALVDLDRDTVASHLLGHLEVEFGRIFPWSTPDG